MKPGGNDGQLLLHAMRIRSDGLRQGARQFKPTGIFMDAGLAVSLGYTKDVRHEIQVFDACHVFIQVRIVRDVGQDLFDRQRILPDRDPAHADLALVELLDAHDRTQGRCLAGAVMADKTVDLARSDVQTQVIDCLDCSECLRQMFDRKHCAFPPHVFMYSMRLL